MNHLWKEKTKDKCKYLKMGYLFCLFVFFLSEDRMKIYVNGHGPFVGTFATDQRNLMNANSNFNTK